MREISADAWDIDCDVLCITTNCTIRDGYNVMGGGIAREASDQFPELRYRYAELIQSFGHHVYLIRVGKTGSFMGMKNLLMFPTKNEVKENSSLARIALSIIETKKLADIYNWKNIALPRPGCGLGGLDWHGKVKPFFTKDSSQPYYLDNRFLVVGFPGEE